MSESVIVETTEENPKNTHENPSVILYRVVFRKNGQPLSCFSKIANLSVDDIVMVQMDQGLEPAIIFKNGILLPEGFPGKAKTQYNVIRRASRDEISKYNNLIEREEEALALCRQRIGELGLKMKLISVERYFNGSKILFYFTADSRVDFRELVKKLVQEFRTRVEMKQIGVRHETKMIGGLGCCGRELCCSSFIGKFAPVSIKMAKEQDLPLNPLKISGVCHRLLCCLTHEYSTYKAIRKEMPRQGDSFTLDGKDYKVIQCNVLSQKLKVISPKDDGPITLEKEKWQKGVFEIMPKKQVEAEKRPPKKPKAKKNKEPSAQVPKKQQTRPPRPNKQNKQKKQ